MTGLEAIISSITASTRKQYNICYQHWWRFCHAGGLDPYTCDLQRVINFLNSLFNQKKSFSTINSYKSALKLVFNIQGQDDDFLKRYMRGIYNSNPSRPKYTETWDPYPVLKYLESLYPLENLALAFLTKKLVTLLALISGHRIQTLAKITLTNIRKYDGHIEIKVSDRVKTSNINKFQPLILIPYFPDMPKLCLAKTLECYCKVTKDLRSDIGSLIITHKKPFHAASAQTISRWIKDTLKLGGIDTSLFSSYSTRHAATSAAFRAGVSVEEICKRAGWSEKTRTFNIFYNKPLATSTDAFARGVLVGSNIV